MAGIEDDQIPVDADNADIRRYLNEIGPFRKTGERILKRKAKILYETVRAGDCRR
jgi:hypothetical protein